MTELNHLEVTFKMLCCILNTRSESIGKEHATKDDKVFKRTVNSKTWEFRHTLSTDEISCPDVI